MSDDKAPASDSDTAKVFDVSKPSKETTSGSKSISITSRPVLKEELASDDKPTNETGEVSSDIPSADLQTSSNIKIAPIHDNVVPEADDEEASQAATTEDAETKPEDSTPEATTTEDAATASNVTTSEETSGDGAAEPNKAAQEKIDEIAARKAAERKAEIQKIALSHKYYLPINQVEKRHNKRVAWAGIVLVVLLAVAWGDISLDAGIVSIPGVKPVTHFFK